MNLRSLAGSSATAILVVLVVAMLVGQQLGQPIVLGFVLTGSMNAQPAEMAPGDGFIAVPPAIAGDVGEGDVVTFEARELQGGGLTTHRIVDETDQGYITQGDANPFTDQDGPEPPVQESQIVAVALQLNGDTVVIPRIGLAVLAIQDAFSAAAGLLSGIPGLEGLAEGNAGSSMVLVGLLLLGYSLAAEAVGGTNRRSGGGRSRDRRGKTSAVLVLLVILLLITVPATASMVIPSGTNDITIVSSQSPSSSPTVIERGGSVEYRYNFTNDGYIPRIASVDAASTGVDVAQNSLVAPRGETASTTVTIHAPEETGAYVRSVSEWQYVQFLPVPVILSLHTIHPFAAVAGINAVIIVAVTAVYVPAVGLEPFRFRDRGRDLSLSQRVRRTIRRWR
ncbi:signal peptidase I [Halorubrum ezzemoulense]|uniref:signal peptidase I n=1 Tax=Halorubrum ezzemoulense TaxID=337243 RepID=UPI00232DAA92|nr:signal peptidase I [Halorubrum ezzemoulense]MDB9249364.1 signal peptidase I [Halorubrum ezzemoulense]MDB9257584.1 signal peptidase I [Halorubrum ezzemoulense]MDB9262053.1 signal peptidase I [Halorubrum ezzemoulense]MDB9265556.1 signal peptidase I [Halorubrum ezzemoulense]MDB9267945.1 signal peptidase I [Halorubrum ezzemoulense]